MLLGALEFRVLVLGVLGFNLLGFKAFVVGLSRLMPALGLDDACLFRCKWWLGAQVRVLSFGWV